MAVLTVKNLRELIEDVHDSMEVWVHDNHADGPKCSPVTYACLGTLEGDREGTTNGSGERRVLILRG